MRKESNTSESAPPTPKRSQPQVQVQDWGATPPQQPPYWYPPPPVPPPAPEPVPAPAAEAPPAPVEPLPAAPEAPASQGQPGVPSLAAGSLPPTLGKTPTSINQLLPTNPYGTKATHFTGPVVSGPTPGNPLGVEGVAQLNFACQIDYTMGNFTLPIQFPTNSFLLSVTTVEYQVFSPNVTAPSISLGSTSGAADILAATVIPAGTVTTPIAGQLPLWTAVSPQVPFQAFLSVAGNTGNTAGGLFLLITYARLALKWS